MKKLRPVSRRKGTIIECQTVGDRKDFNADGIFSLGWKKTNNPVPTDIYGWNGGTVTGILDNRQYTGCAVNGISFKGSYKVHKVIEKQKEEYQIVPNTETGKETIDSRLLYQGLTEFSKMKELTPEIVNTIFKRI